MYIGLYEGARYFCRILMKFEFFRQILKKPKMSNFTKNRPVAAELFHADGQLDAQA